MMRNRHDQVDPGRLQRLSPHAPQKAGQRRRQRFAAGLFAPNTRRAEGVPVEPQTNNTLKGKGATATFGAAPGGVDVRPHRQPAPKAHLIPRRQKGLLTGRAHGTHQGKPQLAGAGHVKQRLTTPRTGGGIEEFDCRRRDRFHQRAKSLRHGRNAPTFRRRRLANDPAWRERSRHGSLLLASPVAPQAHHSEQSTTEPSLGHPAPKTLYPDQVNASTLTCPCAHTAFLPMRTRTLPVPGASWKIAARFSDFLAAAVRSHAVGRIVTLRGWHKTSVGLATKAVTTAVVAQALVA